jgi:hypothetical protein
MTMNGSDHKSALNDIHVARSVAAKSTDSAAARTIIAKLNNIEHYIKKVTTAN